jgi:ribonucleoside-diphosphate reductase alpha chain
MTIVNGTVPMALGTLGYTPQQIEVIKGYILEHGTIIGAPEFEDEHLPVFDVAVGERAISHMGHIKMMGAVQPFLSGAISKTVNMPQTATVEDIAEAYLEAWKLGVKALAIYRDGSKTAQALRTDAQVSITGEATAEAVEKLKAAFSKNDKAVDRAVEILIEAIGGKRSVYRPEVVTEIVKLAVEIARHEPTRKRMPEERQSITHKFSIGGHEGYITAGKYEDGTVGEFFLTDIGKEGSTMRGMMNSFATSMSIALQYGVPLETLVRKFAYVRFEPEGITQNQEIPFAKSMPDYIMRWLASRFLDADTQEELGILTPAVRAKKAGEDAATSANSDTASAPTNGSNGHAKVTVAAGATSTASGPAKLPRPKTAALELGPACGNCGGMMQRTGTCYTCTSCGNTTGCG